MKCGVFSLINNSDSSAGNFSFGTLSDVVTGNTRSAVLSGNATTDVGGGIILDVNDGTSLALTYACNEPSGFSRVISSANNGKLQRLGGPLTEENQIRYTVTHTGTEGIEFSSRELTAPIETELTGNFLVGVPGNISFAADGVLIEQGEVLGSISQTSVFAGVYTDTVTISITSNSSP